MRAKEFTTVLSELFNPADSFNLEWDDSFGPKEMYAIAYDRQGRTIDISIVPITETLDAVEITFARGGQHSVTGQGNPTSTLTTVLKAMGEYITKFHAPEYIVFSAAESSRIRLYDSLVNRLAVTHGYSRIPHSRVPEELQEWSGDHPGYFVLERF